MGADIVLEVATLRHVHLVASRMRAADREEVLASGGYRPAQALRAALRVSEMARTVFAGGEPMAMFGVAPARDFAIPWVLTTDAADRYPMAFWRASKLVIASLHELYPVMVQAIDARYTRALVWIARLGFRVDEEAHPFGKAGLPFHRVTLGVQHV